MTKNIEQNEALAYERYKKLLLLVLGAFLFSILIGGIGGYLIWDSMKAGQSMPRFFLIFPGLVTAIVTGLPIRALKNRWFDTPEDLMKASQYKAKK